MVKSWVINVKTSKAKRDFFTSQARDISLDFKYYNAVTPKTLHNFNYISDEYLQTKVFARPLLKTEIACAISHRNLWKKLLVEKYVNYYCIFEDDTFLNKDIVGLINHDLIKQFDLIKFSGRKNTPNKSVLDINDKYKLFKLAYGPLDAGAYRISKKAASILLSFTYNLTHPIDIMMDRSYDHGIDIHSILPYPCNTEWRFDPKDPLYTDIGPREFKYPPNSSFFSKMPTRVNRVRTSFKKRMSHLKLILKNEK